MSTPRKPTIKEEKFVRTLVTTGNIKESVLEAYDTNKRHASEMGKEILARPRVQARLAEVLDAQYPMLRNMIAEKIVRALSAPIKGSPEDDGSTAAITWADQLRYLEMFAALAGDKAPKKSQSVVATISTPLGNIGGNDDAV